MDPLTIWNIFYYFFRKDFQQENEKKNLSSDEGNITGSLSDKWFYNLTNIDIPSEIVDFVSLGPKFTNKCIMDKPLAVDSIKHVEHFLNSHQLPRQYFYNGAIKTKYHKFKFS